MAPAAIVVALSLVNLIGGDLGPFWTVAFLVMLALGSSMLAVAVVGYVRRGLAEDRAQAAANLER